VCPFAAKYSRNFRRMSLAFMLDRGLVVTAGAEGR
jgi:hypothetical protein